MKCEGVDLEVLQVAVSVTSLSIVIPFDLEGRLLFKRKLCVVDVPAVARYPHGLLFSEF